MGKTRAGSRSSRRARVLGVAAVVVLALASVPGGSSARAAAPSLRWKFKPGETIHYRIDQKTVTQAMFNGQSIKTTVSQTIETDWAVKSVDASGSAEMTLTIDRVKTKVEGPLGSFEYDSREKKPIAGAIAAGVVPILKVLVGATFRFTISPLGALTDVRVPEGLVKALKDAGPAAAQGPSMFSEEGLKTMIHESTLTLPTDADKPWTGRNTIPLPALGNLVRDKTYKYDGPEGDNAKIAMQSKVRLEPGPAANFEAKISAQEGNGRFLFDNTAGRLVRSDVTEKVEMLLNSMNTQVTHTSDNSTTMTLVTSPHG